MNPDTNPPTKSRSTRLGAAAARAAKALQDYKAAEELRRQKVKEQTEKLARLASEEESRLRRAQREHRRREEARFAQRLGVLVMNALRRQGISGVLLTAQALDTWSTEDLRDLKSLLSDGPLPAEHDDRSVAGVDSAGPIDIDLGAV